MPKRIDWVDCPECDGLEQECACCRGGGLVPLVNYEPVAVADDDPWQEVDR